MVRNKSITLATLIIALSLALPVLHATGPYSPRLLKVLVAIALVTGIYFIGSRAMLVLPRGFRWVMVASVASMMLGVAHEQIAQAILLPGLLVLSYGFLTVLLNGLKVKQSDECSATGIVGLDLAGVDVLLIVISSVLVVGTLIGPSYLGLVDTFFWFFSFFPLEHGSFYQPNNFATFLVSVLALSLFIGSASPKVESSKYIYLIGRWSVYLLICWAVVQSGSRIGLIALWSVLGWYLVVFLIRRRFFEGGYILILSAATNFVFPALLTLVSAHGAGLNEVIASINLGDESTSARIGFLLSSWYAGLSQPFFGFGFGSFHEVYPEFFTLAFELNQSIGYVGSTLHPHNEVAHWWVAGGGLGLVVLTGCIGFMLSVTGISLKQPDGIIVFLPIAFHSMTEFPLYNSGGHWLILIIGAAVVAVVNCRMKVLQGPGRANFVGRRIAGVVLLLFSMICAEAVMSGHRAGLMAIQQRSISSFDEYVEFQDRNPAKGHWAYGEVHNYRFILAAFQLALIERRREEAELLYSKLRPAVKFFNNKHNWNVLAAGINIFGSKAELIGFLDYVEGLNSAHAHALRTHYGLN